MMKRNLRRGGYTLIELAIVLALCGILAAIFIPAFLRNKNAKLISCQSNLKQMGVAMLQYTQDYSERLPPVALHEKVSGELPYMKTYGWADGLSVYMGESFNPHCPAAETVRKSNPTQIGFTDYWFNANLSGLLLEDTSRPEETLLSGEGNDGHDQTDARYHLDALPQNWLSNPQSPAQRHEGKGNYLFADGHVKSYSPQVVKAKNWFAVKAAKP